MQFLPNNCLFREILGAAASGNATRSYVWVGEAVEARYKLAHMSVYIEYSVCSYLSCFCLSRNLLPERRVRVLRGRMCESGRPPRFSMNSLTSLARLASSKLRTFQYFQYLKKCDFFHHWSVFTTCERRLWYSRSGLEKTQCGPPLICDGSYKMYENYVKAVWNKARSAQMRVGLKI